MPSFLSQHGHPARPQEVESCLCLTGSEGHQGCSVCQASHQGTPISLLLLNGQQSAVHLVVQGGPAEMGGETGFGTLSLFWPVPRTLPEGQAGALLSEEQSFLHAARGGRGGEAPQSVRADHRYQCSPAMSRGTRGPKQSFSFLSFEA